MRSLVTAIKFGLLCLAMMLVVLVPSTRDAEASGSPCPGFSLNDVLADLDGDWDGDRLENGDEIYLAGLNPCRFDATEFCGAQPQVCRTRVFVDARFTSILQTCVNGRWTFTAVQAFPHADWDNDGVTNLVEANNGVNPCRKPCANLTQTDVALNPWGDWDNDGRSNSYEYRNGLNPCVAPSRTSNRTVVVTTTTTTTTTNTGITTVVGSASGSSASASTPSSPSCPAGYPYWSPTHRQCYANPIRGGFRVTG